MNTSYKEHPGIIEMLNMPEPIRNNYFQFEYHHLNNFDNIPIPLLMLFALQTENTEKSNYTIIGKYHKIHIDFTGIPMREYCRGFIDGYNSNLVPFIDTTDSRKEIILNEATKRINGFVEHHSGKKIEFHEKDFYETGIYEGKRYKAWEIIFETPTAFNEFFAPLKNEFLKNMQGEKIKHYLNWTNLFNEKYGDLDWSLKDIPENANIITTIDLQFNYLEKTIQEKINAALDKQSEINNFLTICDFLIISAKPKCIDPLEKENKDINLYWLSKCEALKIFVAAFERHIPKTSTAEPLKADKANSIAPVETTEQKVRRILAPLKENSKKHGSVIIENESFEKLVSTYVNYIEKKPPPHHVERFVIYGSNPEFYGILKKLHKELPLKVAGIGQALTYILSPNNQNGERGKEITPGTIEKNIKNGGQY